ncbi:MAG: flagellar basal body P-ring protein FlgI [Phycisphaerales bacterium]|nr:flagellar basal body P-ring protein FlgI [Phycisphaerales bacterium]
MATRSSILVPLLAVSLAAIMGCDPIERATPRPKPSSVKRVSDFDVPNIVRGTVGAETVIVGYSDRTSDTYQPLVVRGYGLVVGLDGTGSSDIPPNIRAHMISEMERRGVGSETMGFGHLNAEEMLNSTDTAVVVVEGVMPPAAVGRFRTPPISGRRPEIVPGTPFDVRISADPRTGTTSLEGGTLYTAELRPGSLTTGSRQASHLAEASGSIFLNPFAEPGSENGGEVNMLTGRILFGGEATEDVPIRLMLVNPSHTRVRLIQDAINRRFTREPGQRDTTARGTSDSIIEITVPPSHRENPETFIRLLRHTTLRQANAEAVAMSTRRILLADATVAPSAYWRWCALGNRAIPFIRELYEYSEEVPRLVALRSGAYLKDPLVGNPLRDMTTSGALAAQLEAASLLADLPADPRNNKALRDLLDTSDTELRLRAYESLAKRGDLGISRTDIEDKFLLDVVPSEYPTIYITQSGQPRLAILGQNLNITSPVTVSVWDNRLIVRDAQDPEKLELYYRPQEASSGRVYTVDRNVAALTRFLAHKPTPEDPRPGLGLSYAQTVGAIHRIWRKRFIDADFKVEQDRILAEIRRAGQIDDYEVRPDFDPEPEPTDGTDPVMETVATPSG